VSKTGKKDHQLTNLAGGKGRGGNVYENCKLIGNILMYFENKILSGLSTRLDFLFCREMG